MSYLGDQSEPASPFAGIEDRNELARCILRSGMMHDHDIADLVERAAGGAGEDSQLLRAMVSHSDETAAEPMTLSRSVGPPLPAKPYRFREMSVPEKLKANPFADPLMRPKAVQRSALSREQMRSRPAVLTDEVARLYRCLAFAMHEHGAVMNGHMIVVWEKLGIRDHGEAVAVLTEFNARMGKWLKVEATGRRRKGTTATAWGGSEPYFYAFVHEHASNRGFHTHQLFRVSDGKARAFAEYAVMVLGRLTGLAVVPAEAVMFTPNTKGEGFVPYLPRFKKNEPVRCWIWFRYLAKNLSPHEFMNVGDQYALQRDIFRIRHIFVPPMPVTCADLFGCSENIAVGAQERAGFASKLDSGDWAELYSGSELDEYQERVRQRERDQEVGDILEQVKI